jgi:hypothetical protein
MSDESYNGWKNYPTWAVNLWLSHDEGLYNEAQDKARFASRQADPQNGLASSLRYWVVDELAPDLGASFAADLLGYAFGEVDWYEIADAWLEQVAEDTPSIDAKLEAAEQEGYEAGKAAGSWVIDGNTPEETARYILQGIEDGDPAVMDSLPSSPLSGEWADAPLPRDILEGFDMDEDDDAADDLLTAYEDGFSRGVMDEVERSARAAL